MRILVADNDITHRNIIIQYLHQLGYKTEEALSVNDVLKHCKNKCPDLCLIDMKLSGISGIEVVKQVRQLGGLAVWNPIVLMGTDITAQQLKEGITAGADDFFAKPIDLIRLEYKINAARRQEDLKEQVFSVAHDLVLANRALENVVNKDGLTGTADLNTFHKDLEAEWFKAKNNRTILSLIIIGLDCFKNYNAIYGSAQGDDRIKEVAIALKNVLSNGIKHTFARTVGESFSVLLPEMELKQAIALANKMIMIIESLKIQNAGSRCSEYLTASAGVAATEQEAFKSPLDLIEAADYALYQAKHHGRNRVYCESMEKIDS
jgi:diguanylate cyclase (GGDEF)-like protein